MSTFPHPEPAAFGALAGALDPTLLFRQAVGEPDPWQADLLRCDDQRVLLNCCRQSGKSSTAAVLALHTALFKLGSLTLLVSPSERQSQETFRKVLDGYRRAGRPIPIKSESALRLELANGSRVIALPSTEETLRGFSDVSLLVIDEAARVPDESYYGVRPFLAVSGGRLIAMSTPKGKTGWWANAWANEPAWKKIRITANDCPRISEEFLQQEREALGPFFDQEYFCSFVDGSAEGFISAEWCDGGMRLEPKPEGNITIGLDVARSQKGDKCAFAIAQGQVPHRRDTVLALEQFNSPDLMQTTGRAVQLIERYGAQSIRVDDTGVGGGVTDRLKELRRQSLRGSALWKCSIVGIGFGTKARDDNKFVDWRSEAWWHLGELLRKGDLCLPDRRQPHAAALAAQLCGPGMSQDSRGRLRLESKDSMRRRGLSSPDLGDAVTLALYPDSLFRRGGMIRVI